MSRDIDTDGNLYSLGKHLDEQDKNEKAYEENYKEFNYAVMDELSREISLMENAKDDELKEQMSMELEDDFASIVKRYDVEPISLKDWISDFFEEKDVEKPKKAEKLELTNTQNITEWAQMAPFVTPVSNFISAFNLPSYSYPEVYEYFVAQLDLKSIVDEDENLVFDWGNHFKNCSLESIYILTENIKELDADKKLFFQVRNAEKKAVEAVQERNKGQREANKKEVADVATKIQK